MLMATEKDLKINNDDIVDFWHQLVMGGPVAHWLTSGGGEREVVCSNPVGRDMICRLLLAPCIVGCLFC